MNEDLKIEIDKKIIEELPTQMVNTIHNTKENIIYMNAKDDDVPKGYTSNKDFKLIDQFEMVVIENENAKSLKDISMQDYNKYNEKNQILMS